MITTKTKKMIINAILLAIGLLLHQVTPSLGLPITPDMLLAMMFIVLVINKDDYKTCLVAGIVSGLFTALTTKFPGGQVPNFIDKVVTVNVMFVIMKACFNMGFVKEMKEKTQGLFVMGILLPLGTLLSGTIFIYSAKILVGLPGGATFMAFFMAAVAPAILLNLIFGLFLYKIIDTSLVRSGYQKQFR